MAKAKLKDLWALFYRGKLSGHYIVRPANSDVITAAEKLMEKSWDELKLTGWSVRRLSEYQRVGGQRE